MNVYRRTALQQAAYKGKQDVVKYLHSVDVNSELLVDIDIILLDSNHYSRLQLFCLG